MEAECYKVEVLHFVNPYLIWVEVADPGDSNKNFFEQIGVYGVLPLKMTMDETEDTLTTERSSEWMPAAAKLMKNVLADAAEVSFYPVYIDNRSTIFDDNNHKYGEIVIKKPNGKYRLLSKLLVKSSYAIYNENAFSAELRSGNIKTKLSYSKIKDVIKHLEKKCKTQTQVAKQTEVFQTAQKIEFALTVQNLKAHDRRNENTSEEVLLRKLEDLQMCKDIDENAVGRASKKKQNSSDSSSLLLRKITPLKGIKTEKPSDIVDYFIQKRNEDFNALQTTASKDQQRIFNAQKADYLEKDRLSKEVENEELQKQTDDEKPTSNHLHTDSTQHNLLNAYRKMQQSLKKTRNIHDNFGGAQERKDIGSITETKTGDKSFGSDSFEEEPYMKVKKPKKARASPNKPPDYDIYKETRIAYGPPGTNLTELPCKIVPKDRFVENYDPAHLPEENIPMKEDKEDIFGQEDSDLEIEYTGCTSENAIRKNEISKPVTTSNSMLKQRLRHHREILKKKHITPETSDTSTKDSSISAEDLRFNDIKASNSKNSSKKLDSDDESISVIMDKLKSEYQPIVIPKEDKELNRNESDQPINKEEIKNHVNPFKNVDANVSKFVEKLVTPVLMVHTKMSKRVQPTFSIRDVPFNSHIQIILKNMSVDQPMTLQSITWRMILRGYSTFMISPKRSGKTMGYLPAVCRLVSDKDSRIDSTGPIAIIVCATSNSVTEVENLTRLFLGSREKVLAIYSGMNELHIATSLLNGCDLLVCTPSILVRLLQSDFGVDLRRLTTFVLDDCERLVEVFGNEIKFFLAKIKHMLKNRVQKEVKVQYILSSRIWCDFMEPLAKKAPDTVICIGAFQECVLYSKTHTIASFVTEENKIKSVMEFLKEIDNTKRTVIVCRKDEEVEELEKALKDEKYVVLVSNSEMAVEDLSTLRSAWDDYEDPVIGPILLCLDSNLTHLNITDAHYLIHYSLPSLFSAFCKRFSVLNENYPSIFKQDNENVKIKILLEDGNVEQLPKIMHFIKRCTSEVPKPFDALCAQILHEKDKTKAKKLVPICDNLLTLGECPDFWNCQERHAVFKEFDEPQDWVPKEGTVAFQILHYHTAVFYSARLISHTTKDQTYKYPQNHNMLAMKISMYFSRESNRKLHGVPKVGDICAVSIKQNFFVRCQVLKILNFYPTGKPNYVLVRLIDEEKLETTRDIYLYYLPPEFTTSQTHVIHVRVANLKPRDEDITFSDLAREQLKKITDGEEDLYMRGRISLTIGKCLILESVEAIRDLSTLNKTVVLHNFKTFLLENHALLNEDHIQKLNQLCIEGEIDVLVKKTPEIREVSPPPKKLPAPQWAHLEKADLSVVLLASAENPSSFFVRLVKFEDSCNVLVKDIQKYAAGISDTIANLCVGDIVLAKLPDDEMFERARIDKILNNNKVKCFFVDQGDWREVSTKNLIPITEKIITQLPFQAIECRLIGVKPPGDHWTEFATNWFTNCFEDESGDLKQIYARYYTKEKSQYTSGHKYGVVLVDTNSNEDIVINESIMEVNLAKEDENECEYLNKLDVKKETAKIHKENTDEDDEGWEKVSKISKTSSIDDFERPKISLNDVFLKKPIRSVPLIGSDESETSEDRWQINMTEDLLGMFKPPTKHNARTPMTTNLPAIKNVSPKISEVSAGAKACNDLSSPAFNSSQSDSDSSIQKLSKPSFTIRELDSDDYTSPESSLFATKPTEKQVLLTEMATSIKKTQTETAALKTNQSRMEPEPLRKPKLTWHQKKKNVTIKILLIGADDYDLKVQDRELKFYAVVNDTEYGFDLPLYGIIDKNNVTHSNKGQYIRINMLKLMERNWLTLTRSGGIQKWIVYDVDSIDVESTDEENDDKISKEQLKGLCEGPETDSEDEEFLDDANFGYSR